MLPDLLSDDVVFDWNAPRTRVSDGKPMRSYQLRAAHKIYTGRKARDRLTGEILPGVYDGTAVHIDMGLGKTIVGLTAIAEWFKHGICTKPVLVVAPIKVCESVWMQEAREWHHTKHLTFRLIRGTEKQRSFEQKRWANVHLINPEMLVWLQKYIRANWADEYDALIIDESSMFKDHRAKRFRVLSNYGTRMTVKDPLTGKPLVDPLTGNYTVVPAPRFKRTAILTGTPSPSGLQNLWAPFYLLDHGMRLNRSFDTFQGRFFRKARKVGPHTFKYVLNPDEDEARPEWEVVEGGKERIHELIADITVELNAEDYGVLPKQLPPVKHYIDLPPEILPHYRSVEREAVLEMFKDPVVAANGGAKSMLCWQMCNGAVYSTDEYGRKQTNVVHDRKLDKLVEVIDELDQHALIPYWFQSDLERIVARFKKEGIPYSVLKGKDSQKTIDAWNAGGIPNLLIHPQSAAHGLNLQFGGHNLIWFSTIWSLERYLQTNARLARSGQKEIVGVHVIMARNTTDEVRYNSWFEHGDDMARFRSSMMKYQKTMGLGIDTLPEIGHQLAFDLTQPFAPKPFAGIEL
jgi:hypothetical protein